VLYILVTSICELFTVEFIVVLALKNYISTTIEQHFHNKS